MIGGKERPWLPDGYSQFFFILYVFGPSGSGTMTPLRYTGKFDPFLSLDCARVEGMEDQILPSGNRERGRSGVRKNACDK